MSVPKPLRVVELPPAASPLGPVLTIDPLRTFLVLCGCIAALLAAYLCIATVRLVTHHQSLFGMARLFDVDAEANVPTYFSVLQFTVATALLYAIGYQAREAADRFASHWFWLGHIFLFLGVDELAQVHELVGQALHAWLPLDGALRFVWVIPYGGFAAAVGFAYLGFLRHLSQRTRSLFVSAGLVYIGGAAGLEMYGGYLITHLGPEAVTTSLAYLTEVFFEEGMEMFGIALFIYTLLDYIQASTGRIRINVGPAPAASPEQELDATGALQILQLGERTTRRTS